MKIKAHCPFLGHTGYNAHARGFFTALSELVDLRVDNYTCCDDTHNYLTDHQKRIISEVTLRGPDGEGQYPPDWKEEIENFKYDVDIVLHEHCHQHFWREYTKPKIAYTVWETDRMNDDFFKRLLEYDELWVASEWQRECAIGQGYPCDRVKVVPEAVEPDCFPNNAIVPDDSIFTFCVLGRWDHRKSITEILECFVELFGNNPKVQLIASIDNRYAEDGLSTEERFKKMGWGDIKNIILKSFPSRPKYIDILRRSHVFLSCARSEGWNIPLIEAMACGVPSIYSDCSGQTQFASGKGIPIPILGKERARIGHGGIASKWTTEMPGNYCTPDFTRLKEQMRLCIDNYDTLKARALKESAEIRSQYTWANAARIALKHLENLPPKAQKVNVLIAANDAYLKYANRCIKSIRKHSDYNAILYGYDTRFEGQTVVADIEVRRLNAWPLSKCGRDLGLMSSRISMCLDALEQRPDDRFMMIDADMIAVKDLNPFFSEQFNRLENHPLCITYKHDNLIHYNALDGINKFEVGTGDEAASLLGITKPRGCAFDHPTNFTIAHGLFIFDSRSKDFLTELLELCLDGLDKDSADLIDDKAMVDERIHNALIWKHGLTNHLPLSWVSKDEDNSFLQPDLKVYIDAGFDVVFTHQDRHSYTIAQEQLLFLHGKPSLPLSSQLMVIAHPDDETIFGFSELDGDTDWKIVCVSTDNREDDFHKAMEFYGIRDYETWGFNSSVTEGFPLDSLDKKIEHLINSKQWKKVVTHGPCGEYGHIQHKNVFDSVKKYCDNFYIFCKSPAGLEPEKLQRKHEALKIYSSEDIIPQLQQLNGDWYIMPDMSTNYIEHGTAELYKPSRHITPFIHCWEKTPDYSPVPFRQKKECPSFTPKIKVHCPFLGHTGLSAAARGMFTALSSIVDLRVDNYTWCDDRHNYLTPQQKKIISEVTLRDPQDNYIEKQHPPDWKKEIEDFQYDVDIVFHEYDHEHFLKKYSKPKIAYTVWETDLYGADFFKTLLEYDELWVPSEWQRGYSIAQGYPAACVKVVPLAVEPDCIPSSDSGPLDDSVFTFCLLGRWDHRKSTTEIIRCFVELFGNNPKVQLIASIDNPFALDGLSTEERKAKMGWGEVDNIILKSFLNRKEYVKIIQESHVFLSCARAEGWNIPLLEAMACGVPAIYSDCSAQLEFAQKKGIPVRVLGKEKAEAGTSEVVSQFTANLPGHYFSPDYEHLKKQMQRCIDNYEILKATALKDSVELRQKYTWQHTARIALSHLENFCKSQAITAPLNPKPNPPPASSQFMKKKILFPLITYGGTCNTEFAIGAMGTLLRIQQSSDIDMVVNTIVFESLISRGRNAAAAFALQDDFSHLLFIDSDICFEANDVFKLIEADKDVAVGVYPKKYYSRQKVESLVKRAPHVFNDKNEWRALSTDFSTELNAAALDKARKGEIFTVDYAATGFMLIKTDVFRKIIDKCPDLKYHNDVDGYMSAGDNFYDFFTVGVNKSNKKYESEDYGFCQLWRSLGGQIHVVPSINLTHTGRNHYPGNIQAQAKMFQK